MVNERQLIEQVLAGDQEAFSQLVLAYEDRVYHLCFRMCSDAEEAKDLAQEAFVKAWKGLRFYKGDASFSTWLYRLTTNVCIDHLRQKKRKGSIYLNAAQDEHFDVPDIAPTPEEQANANEMKRLVTQAMAQLEEEFRLVLTLRVVEELSYDEIAQITDLKPGTIKSRICRAREKLRKILLQNGNDFFSQTVKEGREEDGHEV